MIMFVCRGYIYNSRDIDKGLLVYCKGRILYRELAADENHSLPFCRVLNKTTLQVSKSFVDFGSLSLSLSLRRLGL